jgi:DNA-directed RNA polymerase subunit RPC12/RpoP
LSEKKEGYTFRCMRCLGGRIFVPYHKSKAWCPYCGQGWRVTWVTPEIAKIRGRILNGGESHGERGDC